MNDAATPARPRAASDPAARNLGSSRFVAREAELAPVLSFLANPRDPHPRLLVLQGESGIGKTRLLYEATRIARRSGATVLSARSEESSQGVPLSLWAELLRQARAVVPRRAFQAAAEPHMPALTRLVPELADEVWLIPAPDAPPPEPASLEFPRQVAAFFARLGAHRPLVVALDDLPLADQASLDPLRDLVRRPVEDGVLVVGSARDTHLSENAALTDLLANLHREGGAQEISVDRLGREDTRALVESLLGEPGVSDELLDTLFERSAGNPFFLHELVRSLVEVGELDRRNERWAGPRDGTLRVPATVRSVVDQRLSRASPACRTTLEMGGVLGLEFPVALLAGVAAQPETALVPPLEEAFGKKLLRETTDPNGRVGVAFTHPLIQEVVVGNLSELRRREYHLRAARVIEAAARPDTRTESALIAFHYLKAGDRPNALHYSVEAGELSWRRFARREAIDHFRTALAAGETLPASLDRALAAEKLAAQLHAVGEDSEGVELLERASAEFLTLGDVDASAGALVHLLYEHGATFAPEHRNEVMDRARALLRSVPQGIARCYLLRYTAWLHAMEGRFRDAALDARQALEVALVHPDKPNQIAMTRLLVCNLAAPEGREEAAKLHAAAGEHIETKRGFEALEMWIEWGFNYQLGWTGDLSAAVRWIEAPVERMRQSGRERNAATLEEECRTVAGILSGDFAEVEGRLSTFETRVQDSGAGPTQRAVYRAIVLAHVGPLDRATRALAKARASRRDHLPPSLVARIELASSRIARFGGDLDQAWSWAEAAATHLPPADLPAIYVFERAQVLDAQVRLADWRGRPSDAVEPLRELQDLARRMDAPHVTAYADRASAIVATRARTAEAMYGLGRSLATWTKLGWRPEAAATLEGKASVLRRSGDAVGARKARDEAISAYRSLGAALDVAWLESRQFRELPTDG